MMMTLMALMEESMQKMMSMMQTRGTTTTTTLIIIIIMMMGGKTRTRSWTRVSRRPILDIRDTIKVRLYDSTTSLLCSN